MEQLDNFEERLTDPSTPRIAVVIRVKPSIQKIQGSSAAESTPEISSVEATKSVSPSGISETRLS
jgi:hypothetical protein